MDTIKRIEKALKEIDPNCNIFRFQLIQEVKDFTQKAQKIPGVIRIALIGSLTTNKPKPKDVDLLVTVSDDADLTPIAELGRKLNGHALSFGGAGEVFLANPQGNYLGRTCVWKTCRPGIRARCDALHCGQRAYLHDDLNIIRLDNELIVTPPIELWPRLINRVPLPKDIEICLGFRQKAGKE